MLVHITFGVTPDRIYFTSVQRLHMVVFTYLLLLRFVRRSTSLKFVLIQYIHSCITNNIPIHGQLQYYTLLSYALALSSFKSIAKAPNGEVG